LRENYQPARIIAFGSLVHSNSFGLHSDLDIAVEGIPWLDYLHACNDVEALFPLFKVDLIDIELVSDLVRRRIEPEGQPL
jgi:predicted nucleotidyltransferase